MVFSLRLQYDASASYVLSENNNIRKKMGLSILLLVLHGLRAHLEDPGGALDYQLQIVPALDLR